MPTIDTDWREDEAEFVRHYVLTPTTLRNYDAKYGEGVFRGGVPSYVGDLSPMHLQASSAYPPSHVTFNVMHQPHHHHHLPRPKKTRRYASATMLLAFVTLASFVYGAYQLNWVVPVGWALYTAPIPSDPTLPFMVLEAWPSCLDRRSDVWRLLSYQFTHAGFFHCIMNQITLLTYGCLLEPQLQGKDPLGATTTLTERLMGSLTVFVAFQSAVVLGSLANAYNFGYSSLVGNSGGVYGLGGSCCLLSSSSSPSLPPCPPPPSTHAPSPSTLRRLTPPAPLSRALRCAVGLGWACLATRRLSYMPEGRLEAVLLVTLVCQLVFDILSFTVFFNAAFG